MEKVSTGIKGLDDMLQGGLIQGRPYAVTGNPGSGKTTLGIQFLMDGIRNGENVILCALDEPPNEIKSNAQGFGFDIDSVRILDAVPDVRSLRRGGPILDIGTVLDFQTMRDVREIRASRRMGTVEVSIHSVQKMLNQEAQDFYEDEGESYSRVVIDSMTALKMFGMGGEDRRILIQSFMRFLAEWEVTALIITELQKPDEINTDVFLSRGEIRLHKMQSKNKMIRGLSIEKMRGTDFDENIRPMRISSSGIEVESKGTFGAVK